MAQNDQLEFGPVFDKSVTSETAIAGRMAEDTNQGVEETDETWTDTRTGSVFQILLQSIVQELGRIWDALSVEVPSAAFPTRAWGDYLDEWMAAFNKERNAAVKAEGTILFSGIEGALVPAQTRVSALQTDPNIAPPEFVTTDEGGSIVAQILAPVEFAGETQTGGTLEGEVDYFYMVTAVNAYGETLQSLEVHLKTSSSKKKVELTWGAVDGAVAYRVYRSTSTGPITKRLLEETANLLYVDTGAAATEEILPTTNATGGKYRATIEATLAGTQGNVGVGGITAIQDTLEGVDSASNDEPTLNGADEQDDEELRVRLLLEFQGSGGGNQTDYQRWALEIPGIGIVTVIPVADGPGTVKVVILSPEGDPVSEDLVDELQEILDPLPGQGAGLAPIDHTVTVVTGVQIGILAESELEFEAGFSLDGAAGTVDLRGTIRVALAEYVDKLPAGEDVIYDRVKAAIYSVEGVRKVKTLKVNGGTTDVAIESTPAQTASLETPILTS